VEYGQTCTDTLPVAGIGDLLEAREATINIVHMWEDLGAVLQLRDGKISEIGQDHGDAKSRMKEVLSEWLRGNGAPRCWRTLTDALKSPLVNRPDVAEEIEKICDGLQSK